MMMMRSLECLAFLANVFHDVACCWCWCLWCNLCGVGVGVGNKPNLLYLCIHFQKTKDHISTTMGSKILVPRTLKKKENNIIIVG